MIEITLQVYTARPQYIIYKLIKEFNGAYCWSRTNIDNYIGTPYWGVFKRDSLQYNCHCCLTFPLNILCFLESYSDELKQLITQIESVS